MLATTSGSHLPVRVTFCFQRVRLLAGLLPYSALKPQAAHTLLSFACTYFLLINFGSYSWNQVQFLYSTGLSMVSWMVLIQKAHQYFFFPCNAFLTLNECSACKPSMSVWKHASFRFRIAHLRPVPAAWATSHHPQPTIGSCIYVGV